MLNFRDIKPHNILMDDQGHVHLADFNIATYLHAHRMLTSNSGTGYYIGKTQPFFSFYNRLLKE